MQLFLSLDYLVFMTISEFCLHRGRQQAYYVTTSVVLRKSATATFQYTCNVHAEDAVCSLRPLIALCHSCQQFYCSLALAVVSQ